MADRTAFIQGVMVPDKRPPLIFVTFKAGLVNVLQGRGGPGLDVFPVRVVTIRAADLAFK